MADDAAPGDPGPAPSPDPALSYPRGNRLGIRHPRPTVVIALAVLLVVGGAWAWQSLRPEGVACELALSIGNVPPPDQVPPAASPEAAFAAWWASGGADDAFGDARRSGRPVERPSEADFQRVDERRWEWRYAENEVVRVDVDDTNTVSGVNRCSYFPA